MGKISLLDCTLRDGGYYNNWDFPKDLIDEYLKAMSAAKIEYVELGREIRPGVWSIPRALSDRLGYPLPGRSFYFSARYVF